MHVAGDKVEAIGKVAAHEPGAVLRNRVGDAWHLLRAAASNAKTNRLTLLAQALAYSLFLAIPAFLLVLLGAFSIAAGPGTIDRLIARVEGVVPSEAADLLRQSLTRSAQPGSGGFVLIVVGALLAIWTTSSAATTLMDGLTAAYGRNDKRSFLRRRVVGLALVALLVASAALVGGLLILGPYLERWTGDAIGRQSATAWLWWSLQWPILIGALFVFFALLLYLGPDVDQESWRTVVPGTVAATVIWLVASSGFAMYVSHFGSYNKTWGTLAGVVVMLIWLWLTSAALLFGAELNAEAQRGANSHVEASALSSRAG
jgi:membrane protein